MNENTYNLDLSSFILGFENYQKFIINHYSQIDRSKKLKLTQLLPQKIRDILVYSNINFSVRINEDEEIIDNSDAFYFVKEKFFAEKEKMLGLLQLLINENKKIWEDIGILKIVGIFYKITEPINNPIFDLDFYFDQKDCKIKAKLDPISTQNINQIHQSLENQN